MRQAVCFLFLSLLFLILAVPSGTGLAQEELSPGIVSPGAGEAIQGVVQVSGTTLTPGFQSAELSFGYDNPTTGTWFLIQPMSQPVENGSLGAWDTTLLSDGTYVLRLVIYLEDGSSQESRIDGLRVRNYTPIETSTPTQTPVEPTRQVTQTPRPTRTTPPSTATPLPPNPASVSQLGVIASLVQGGFFALAFFAGLGLYLIIRSFFKRS